MRKKVLVIDDDPLFSRALKYGLQDETTTVYYAESVEEAMLRLTQNEYALVIMDTQLTGADGLGVLGVIRQAKLAVPIMIVTSDGNLGKQLLALETGADIVLEKKGGPLEYFIGHARALMLRNEERKKAPSSFPADLLIDVPARVIKVNDTPIRFRRKEFDILSYMAGNPGIVLTPDMIYGHIWGWETVYNVEEAVRYYIKILRKKLSVGGKNYIETEWGVGYRFNPCGVKVKR